MDEQSSVNVKHYQEELFFSDTSLFVFPTFLVNCLLPAEKNSTGEAILTKYWR